VAAANLVFVFHPGAADDYEEAFAWYFARGPALASGFEREVDRCLRLIACGGPSSTPSGAEWSCENSPTQLFTKSSTTKSLCSR